MNTDVFGPYTVNLPNKCELNTLADLVLAYTDGGGDVAGR